MREINTHRPPHGLWAESPFLRFGNEPPPRGTERNGVDYFFLSPADFRERIAHGEFVEYEEVYRDRYYGTLKSQVEERVRKGENIVFDVDVNGAMRLKQYYAERALSLFIQPPSIAALRSRLEGRATDAPEVIDQRIERAAYELSLAPNFDRIVVNDNLDEAEAEIERVVSDLWRNEGWHLWRFVQSRTQGAHGAGSRVVRGRHC